MVWQWMSSLMRGIMNEAADDMMFKMIKDKYTDNMLMVMSVMKGSPSLI